MTGTGARGEQRVEHRFVPVLGRPGEPEAHRRGRDERGELPRRSAARPGRSCAGSRAPVAARRSRRRRSRARSARLAPGRPRGASTSNALVISHRVDARVRRARRGERALIVTCSAPGGARWEVGHAGGLRAAATGGRDGGARPGTRVRPSASATARAAREVERERADVLDHGQGAGVEDRARARPGPGRDAVRRRGRARATAATRSPGRDGPLELTGDPSGREAERLERAHPLGRLDRDAVGPAEAVRDERRDRPADVTHGSDVTPERGCGVLRRGTGGDGSSRRAPRARRCRPRRAGGRWPSRRRAARSAAARTRR